jgi:hypothetical protein
MKSLLALMIILAVLSGYAENQIATNNIQSYQYTVPEEINDGWDTASLNGVNLDTNLIKELFEQVSDPRNDAAMMASKADFFRYILERPVATTPGTKFVYNSGISLMLGEIIYKASGLRADKFAEHYLFSPLGITNYY